MASFRKPLWFVKTINYEYWNWVLFYMPMLPCYLYQAYRAKSFTFFTNVNPSMEYGGFFGSSKIDILNKLNPEYLPKTIFIPAKSGVEIIEKTLIGNIIEFPIICKPNIGERGKNVEKIDDLQSLKNYIKTVDDFIIQEFIAYPIELGILYYKMPNQSYGRVTSITKKKFLSVTGDGQKSILELMRLSERTRFQIKTVKSRLGGSIHHILEKGKTTLLEPIGNHCRGTEFINCNYLINKNLDLIFDQISGKIEGFHYGRFDLKVDSIENLYLGKNIKILELNGANSDPAHIFDQTFGLLRAYNSIAFHWKILADISIAQQKIGIKPISLKIIWTVVKEHF